MWSDSTKEKKFGDEHAPKWEKELRKLLCFTARLIIIIQTHFFPSRSLSSLLPCASLSRDPFQSRIENYIHTIYLFLVIQ